MKKVFLSLAALTFVATGTLSVTSCGGSDDKPAPAPAPNPDPNPDPNPEPDPTPDPTPDPDPTPAPDPSPDSTGKIMYNGQEYNINSTSMGVWTNQQKQILAYSHVVGQDTISVTVWDVVSWEGSLDQLNSTSNYVLTRVLVPLKAGAEPNSLEVAYPNEAETVYVIASALYAGSAETPVSLGEFTSGEFNMTELTPAQSGQLKGKTKYTSSFTGSEASFNVTFDGDLYGPFAKVQQTGNSVNSTQVLKTFNKADVTKINLKHLLKK